MSLNEVLPQVNIERVVEWLAGSKDLDNERRDWEVALARLLKRWKGGVTLSAEEVDFLAISATSYFDAPERLKKSVGPYFGELQRACEEALNKDRRDVVDAWNGLKKAFARQLQEADKARSQNRQGSTKTLNQFNAALEDLKRSVKRHSGTPPNRQVEDPASAAAIREMKLAGKTYGEIARDVSRTNPQRRITAKQAERIHKRDRERTRNLLLFFLHELFSQPPQDIT